MAALSKSLSRESKDCCNLETFWMTDIELSCSLGSRWASARAQSRTEASVEPACLKRSSRAIRFSPTLATAISSSFLVELSSLRSVVSELSIASMAMKGRNASYFAPGGLASRSHIWWRRRIATRGRESGGIVTTFPRTICAVHVSLEDASLILTSAGSLLVECQYRVVDERPLLSSDPKTPFARMSRASQTVLLPDPFSP